MKPPEPTGISTGTHIKRSRQSKYAVDSYSVYGLVSIMIRRLGYWLYSTGIGYEVPEYRFEYQCRVKA